MHIGLDHIQQPANIPNKKKYKHYDDEKANHHNAYDEDFTLEQENTEIEAKQENHPPVKSQQVKELSPEEMINLIETMRAMDEQLKSS